MPALLVGLHVFGATALWAVTVALVLQTVPARRLAPVGEGAPVAAAAVASDAVGR